MDKNSDFIFKAFIVNAKEYDNGNKETSGAWLYFPTTKEEVSALFKEIGLPNNADSNQYFIDEYKCGNTDLEKFLSMDGDIDELNYLASRISELEDIEMTVFQAVIQTKECQSIKDAINLTYNTECFDIVSDMGSWENIGAYIAEREGLGIEVLGDLSKFIDYGSYGRAYANDNVGYFLKDIYLEKNSANIKEKYNGNIETIPPEYIVTENGKNLNFDIQLQASMELAIQIDDYLRRHNSEYVSKYTKPDEPPVYISDCLMSGATLALKDMLTETSTLQGDTLVDKICEFEQKYTPIDGFINYEQQKESVEQNMSDKMKVLVVEPMQEPYIKEIDAGLKSLQKEVGGSIQAIYPFEEEAAIICNEEGKINGLELNRALLDDNLKIYDVIAGTFLICGLTGDSFGSLPDELINKFSEQFKHPETFVKVGNDIIAIATEPRKPSIKEQLQRTKNEQGKQQPKPPQKPEPEL